MKTALTIGAIILASEAAIAMVWPGQLKTWYAQATRGVRVLIAALILVAAVMWND